MSTGNDAGEFKLNALLLDCAYTSVRAPPIAIRKANVTDNHK